MTLQEFKDEYASDIRNHDVSVLRANRELMLLCCRNSEFKAYVLSVRPEMEREPNPYPCKFKKREKFVPDHIDDVNNMVQETVRPEPVEKISKTAQLVKDIFKYRDTKFMK